MPYIPRDMMCLVPPDYSDPTCHPSASIPCYLPKGHDEGSLGTPHTWQSPAKVAKP
jgi:hypothetical protein